MVTFSRPVWERPCPACGTHPVRAELEPYYPVRALGSEPGPSDLPPRRRPQFGREQVGYLRRSVVSGDKHPVGELGTRAHLSVACWSRQKVHHAKVSPSLAGAVVVTGSVVLVGAAGTVAARKGPATGTESRASASATWQAANCPGATSPSSGVTVLHSSMAYGQRGWKRQPGAGLTTFGGSPTSDELVSSSGARGSGTADSSNWVYGWRGDVSSCSVGPISTTWPAYMTITRSATNRAEARSWVM